MEVWPRGIAHGFPALKCGVIFLTTALGVCMSLSKELTCHLWALENTHRCIPRCWEGEEFTFPLHTQIHCSVLPKLRQCCHREVAVFRSSQCSCCVGRWAYLAEATVISSCSHLTLQGQWMGTGLFSSQESFHYRNEKFLLCDLFHQSWLGDFCLPCENNSLCFFFLRKCILSGWSIDWYA